MRAPPPPPAPAAATRRRSAAAGARSVDTRSVTVCATSLYRYRLHQQRLIRSDHYLRPILICNIALCA